MAVRAMVSTQPDPIPSELATYLGVRRTMVLRRILKKSGLPVEVVLDLALELQDIAARKPGTLGEAPRRAGTRGHSTKDVSRCKDGRLQISKLPRCRAHPRNLFNLQSAICNLQFFSLARS